MQCRPKYLKKYRKNGEQDVLLAPPMILLGGALAPLLLRSHTYGNSENLQKKL